MSFLNFFRRKRQDRPRGPFIEDAAKITSTSYVADPATNVYSLIWGAVQFDDLNRYYHLYYNVPFIKGAIDILSAFAVWNGWEWEGGRDDVRNYVLSIEKDLDMKNFLREYIRLGLVYGTAFAEIIYENPPKPIGLSEISSINYIPYTMNDTWQNHMQTMIDRLRKRCLSEIYYNPSWGRPIALKTLDTRQIRVLGDSKGIVWGFVQFGTPSVYLRKSQVLYWPHNRRSELYEYYYGTSLLRPVLRIQAIITQLEEDISLATHFQAYTPIKVKVGDPQNPLPESKFKEIKSELEVRKAGGNIIVPGYVDVEWMPLQQTLAGRIEWFFNHLLREREQAIGVPRLFFGEVGGVSRGAAELLLHEFEVKISNIQSEITKTLMEQLYLPVLMAKFPELRVEDIPQMVWKPVLAGELRQKVISAIEILRNEAVSGEEKAKALEYLKDVIGVE